ncbi:MAG: aldehyde dehydrogenase family protein [Mycoplasma sp.]|nr:aldehyde dehydrogenase family protein [Mycoplasma sp.]
MEGKLFKVLVGNKIIDDFNDVLNIVSPINNQIIGSIPRLKTKDQIDEVFHHAKNSFYRYRETSFASRKEKLLKFSILLKENWDEISNLMVWEIAKSKRSSIEEIDRTVEYIRETISEYEKIMNNPLIIDESIHNIKGKTGYFTYEPLGVVLAISPFNYPLNLLISKLAPALISGNTVVYKPSTQGSCLGAYISILLCKAGFTNGEVSCVIGKGSEIGDYIIENKNIDMISFTGSTKIGKKIAEKNPFIPVILELGGKDAAIVLKDADLKETAKRIVAGSFSYNGQRCTGIKRVLVDQKIKDELVEHIDQEISKLTVGSAALGNYDITEMIDDNSIKYNLNLLLDAYKNNAKTNQEIKKKNNILYPIALYNVNLNCRIAWEEQFGPVLPIISYHNIEEAIDIHNKSEYGLQASIFTKDIDSAKRISKYLEVGTVNINRAPSRGPDVFPFGGVKNSAKGLQGIKYAIISMNKLKGVIEND